MAQGVRGKANGGEFGELSAVPHRNAAQIFLVIGGEFANRRVTGSLAPDEPLGHDYMTAPLGPHCRAGVALREVGSAGLVPVFFLAGPARLCQRARCGPWPWRR